MLIARLSLALPEPEGSSPELMAKLNRVAGGNTLTANEVQLRAMFVTDDRINSFGGRFPQSELPHVCRLMVDSPVMIGHRKDSLPIGRTFHAQLTERDSIPWVKSFFYWPKVDERLATYLDSGVIKECSLAFTFQLPECSVCRTDIRRCRHTPLERLTVHGREHVCHFNYRKIDRILETSLVYRGAVANTAVVKA